MLMATRARCFSMIIRLIICLTTSSSHPRLSAFETTDKGSHSTFCLRVSRKVICADQGEAVTINCSLRAKKINRSLDDWSLSWLSQGNELRTNVTQTERRNSFVSSELSVVVSWSNKKVFTCVGNKSRTASFDGDEVLKISVKIKVKPPKTSVPGLKFLEADEGVKKVEIHWRAEDLTSVNYTVRYCYVSNFESPRCPNYAAITKYECRLNKADQDTRQQTSRVATCKAWLSYGNTAILDEEHKLHIVSNRAGCENTSPERRFKLQDIADPNEPHVVAMTPYRVVNLQVEATRQRTVRLTWVDPRFVEYASDRKYRVDYNCSGQNQTFSKQASLKQITLRSSDFKPYRPFALCQFCVRATILSNNPWSEPSCNTTRLHEEAPTAAPKITCTEDSCETTTDGVNRNITVTWSLPPSQHWNGVLDTVKAIYRKNSLNDSRSGDVVERNLTSGVTVLRGLDVNSTYIIEMVACNRVGCSNRSNAVVISPVRRDSDPIPVVKQPRQSSGSNLWVIIGASVGTVVGVAIVVLIVAVVLTLHWRRSRRKAMRDPLPSLQGQDDTYCDIKACTDTAEYEKVEDGQARIPDQRKTSGRIGI